MDILNLPDDLKQRLRDGVVNSVACLAENVKGGDKIAKIIRQLSSQAAFYNAFDQAMQRGVKRFATEYVIQDEDLVEAIISDGTFWQSHYVRQALMTMLHQPGSWNVQEREIIVQHFADVLPKRVNRERVDKAVTFLLGGVLEELWTLPGVREIREIYSLQFQKIGIDVAQRQVALLEAQLEATTQLNTEVRHALLQLATLLEQRLLAAPQLQPILPSARPYHNLFQPEYTRFIGRRKELNWLRRRLRSKAKVWQMMITGIGGVGKSALALAIAHEYHTRYNELPPEERFEAIIWITAKEVVLTIDGKGKSALSGLIFHTLEDIYTAIAQTLEREDITRALPENQDVLVQKALGAQRTLLILDNLESVTDDRVRTFLNHLPVSTKCLITSREWVESTAVLKLTGLSPEEAEKMITEESKARGVELNTAQLQRLFIRTAGLPLPIKLSAARMDSGETFEQVIRWLGKATGDLPEYCVKGQIVIVQKRNLNAWKILLTCSLFDQEAGILRETLGNIADLSLDERDDGLTLLQRLSLLNRDEDDRFWILPMVQEYLGTELEKADFGKTLTERWLNWSVEFTQNYAMDLDLHVERAQTIGLEYPHLLNAIRWCQKHEQWELLLQLVENTWFYPYLVGLFGELREMLGAGLQATKSLQSEQGKGRLLSRLGRLLWVQGQYDKTLKACLENAEAIALRYKDDKELGRLSDTLSARALAWTLYRRGTTLIELGNTTIAEAPLIQSLDMATSWNDRHLIARNQLSLARIYADTGRLQHALQAAEDSCNLFERLGMTAKLAEANAILQKLQDSV